MNREEKQKQVDELRGKFNSATVAILTEYSGLNVEEMTDLRRKLRSADAEFRVVKNTIAIRATEGTALVDVRDGFEGPTAVTFGYGDPVLPTKVIQEFSDKQELLKVKKGVVEGRSIDSDQIKKIAKLPGREVLLTRLVTQIQAPLVGLVYALQWNLQQLVGTLESIKEKKS